MELNNLKTIRSIQDQFQEKFPYLNINFYREAYTPQEGSPNVIKWKANRTIGEIKKMKQSGNLSIGQDQKTEDLKTNLKEQYGLNALVFYKSGGIWLQTMKKNDWTLKQQNGRAASYTKNQENKTLP
jgi:hypothetical protein